MKPHPEPLGLTGADGFLFLRMDGNRGALGAAFWQARLPGDARLVYHRLGPAEWAPPLHPLITFLVDELRLLRPDDRARLVKQAGFGPSWHDPVLRFVESGEARRQDEFLYASAGLRFDQDVLFEACGRLLNLLARRRTAANPLVLVWEDFQNAGQALLAWTLRRVAHPVQGLVLAVAFRGRVSSGGLDHDLWTLLLQAAETRGYLQRAAADESLLSGNDAVPPSDSELLSHARNARGLLALEDALRGYQELERRGYDADGPLLPLETGEVLLLLGRIDQAALPLNQALERSRRLKKKPLLAKALSLLCFLSLLENDLGQARRYWRMAAGKGVPGRAPRDENWYALQVLRVVLHQATLDDSWFGDEFDELKAFYRGREQTSTLNYLETLVPYYRFRLAQVGWAAARDEALAVRERLRRSGERYWESVVLHCLGFIHEHEGLKVGAKLWFRRAIDLRRRLGDAVELIKVYNGAGYFHFTIGEFAQSARYYRQSLALLERVRDFPEICLTLFNMTLIYFFSGSFPRALEFLLTILEIMDALGLEVLPWHRKPKLYALAGVCAVRTGHLSLALEYSDRARAQAVDSEAEPYLLLLEVLLNQGPSAFPTNLERFDRALELVGSESQVHFRIHLLAERAQYQGLPSGATSLTEGLHLAQGHGLVHQQRLLEALAAGSSIDALGARSERLPERTAALIAALRSSARQEASNRLLLEKVQEVSFLRHFQSQVTSEQDADTLFRQVFELVRGQFLFQAGAVWRGAGAASVLVQGFGTLHNRPEHQFTYRFKTSGPASLWLVLEADAEDRTLSLENQRTLTMAFQHLDLVLELLEAREILRKAATRDRLTGLFSRTELLERIEAERRRALRHVHQPERTLSLLFLDLDNFKTYNDTFGHAVGDAALQRFAQLVLAEVRTLDVLGRYGGDEFLLMLPETPEAGARVTASRILDAMARAGGFLEALSDQGGAPLSLPPEKRLGCSIGIAVLARTPTADTATLIGQADAALYRTKARQKGTYSVHGD